MASRGGADVGRRLMIKYGLPSSPSDILIERWRARTNQLIVAGAQREPQVERLLLKYLYDSGPTSMPPKPTTSHRC